LLAAEVQRFLLGFSVAFRPTETGDHEHADQSDKQVRHTVVSAPIALALRILPPNSNCTRHTDSPLLPHLSDYAQASRKSPTHHPAEPSSAASP